MTGAQSDVHLFERSKESGKEALEVRRAAASLMEVAAPELPGNGDYGSAHRSILLGPLCPG